MQFIYDLESFLCLSSLNSLKKTFCRISMLLQHLHSAIEYITTVSMYTIYIFSWHFSRVTAKSTIPVRHLVSNFCIQYNTHDRANKLYFLQFHLDRRTKKIAGINDRRKKFLFRQTKKDRNML